MSHQQGLGLFFKRTRLIGRCDLFGFLLLGFSGYLKAGSDEVMSRPVERPPAFALTQSYIEKSQKFALENFQRLGAMFPSEDVQSTLWRARECEYKELFLKWGISSGEMAKVGSIIQARDSKVAQSRNTYLQLPVGSVESKRAQSEMQKYKDQARDELDVIIGKERVDELRFWEETRKERQHLEAVSRKLEASGLILDPQQEQSVLTAIYRVTQSLGKGSISRAERAGSAYVGEVVRQVSHSLAPEQIKVLEGYLQEVAARRR